MAIVNKSLSLSVIKILIIVIIIISNNYCLVSKQFDKFMINFCYLLRLLSIERLANKLVKDGIISLAVRELRH